MYRTLLFAAVAGTAAAAAPEHHSTAEHIMAPDVHDQAAGRKRAALLRREAELLQKSGAGGKSADVPPATGDDDSVTDMVGSRSMQGYGIAGVRDIDGDEGDVGMNLAGDSDQADDVSMESMSGKKEAYTVWESIQKEGAHMILHWLDFGCGASLVDNTTFAAHTRFEKADQRVGRVQCCGSANNTQGTFCTRRDAARNGTCFGGGGLHTFMEARNLCNAANMRLCTRQELQTSDSLGCCSDECSLNQELVWTSTHDFTTVRNDNDHMKEEIERLQEENGHLKDDHEAMEEEYRLLVSEIQEYFDKHPTTQEPRVQKTTTTTIYGLSAEDIKELKESAEFVHESHAEMDDEAHKLSTEWKAIVNHMPNVDIPAGGEAEAHYENADHVVADVTAAPISDEPESP